MKHSQYQVYIIQEKYNILGKEIEIESDRFKREYQKLRKNIDIFGLSKDLIEERNKLFLQFATIYYKKLKYKQLAKIYIKLRLQNIY